MTKYPKENPKPGVAYTIDQIMNVLDLDDIPCLEFSFGDRTGVIQLSHMTEEQILSVPNFSKSLWTYAYTTRERIPVFHWSNKNTIPVSSFLLLEIDNENPKYWWACLKGFLNNQCPNP